MSPPERRHDPDLAQALTAAGRELDGAFAARSRAFIGVGDHLGEAVGVFRNLTSVFDAMPTALSNPELDTGSGALEQVARECSAIHDVIPAQVQAMQSLAGATCEIGKRLDQLSQNISTIATIALNARIEASALKRNSQDMLTFTYDVAKLAAAAEETINQYMREQRNAHGALLSARGVLTSFEKNHRAQLASVSGELKRNLAAIESRRAAALSQSAEISARSRNITDSIGAIITALQIADITSQRFAHVSEAVEQLLHGMATGDGPADAEWAAGLTPEECSAVAAHVAALQAAQIDSALSDLRAETKSIEAELNKLAADAAAMGEQGAALYGGGNAAGTSFIGELSTRLDQAGRLLSDCERAGTLVDQLNESVGTKFGSLHRQAGSIEGIVGIVGGVRLIGLNAYLKADGLGPEGRTLSAISRELRSSADLITGHAKSLIQAMDQTIVLFDEVKKQNGAIGTDRLAALQTQMAGALTAFEASGAKLESALAMLTAGGESVRAILKAALACLAQQDNLEARLDAACKALREASNRGGAAADTPLVKARAAEYFSKRYTMSAERNIHHGKAGGKASAAVEAAETDLESIFF